MDSFRESEVRWVKTAAAALLLLVATVVRGDEVRCRSRLTFDPAQLNVTVPFERASNGVFVRARVNKNPEPLWFVLDSGSARTLISESAAKRLLLNPTNSKDAFITLGTVKIEGADLRITKLAPLTKAWGRQVDGVLGYDLLCRSVVTIDYDKPQITLTHPAVFHYSGTGERLRLAIRNGWSYVQGTIKVTGFPPIIDTFLIDSGSNDAVNHPIIRDSKGPLQKVRAGFLGPNEWFQLGQYTIGSTDSACCGATDEANRQIGGEVLSRFRVTFDYPHRQLILERNSR